MNRLLQAALRPWDAFPLREEAWPKALGRMLAWRAPLGLLELALAWRALGVMRAEAVAMQGPLWSQVLRQLPPEVSPAEVQDLLRQIPAPPPLAEVWPWLLLAAPLLLAGAWAHHAVWDHGCLWLLKGVPKPGRGFKGSLGAEAQALEVGVVGAALGLLRYLPTWGPLLGLPLGCVGLWFWGMRGVALAKAHGVPVWKGVAATGLHALLVGCCAAGLLFVMVMQLAGAMVGG